MKQKYKLYINFLILEVNSQIDTFVHPCKTGEIHAKMITNRRSYNLRTDTANTKLLFYDVLAIHPSQAVTQLSTVTGNFKGISWSHCKI
jgi:hypothetical protein